MTENADKQAGQPQGKQASLRRRLIAATLTCLALVLATSGWYGAQRERAALLEQVDAQGRSLGRAAASAVLESLLIRDYPVIESYAEGLVSSTHDVVYIGVRRADGKLVAEVSAAGHPLDREMRRYRIFSRVDPSTKPVGEVEVGISTRRAEMLVTDSLQQLAIETLIAFVVLGALLWLLLRSAVTRPLSRLSASAERIGGGDLETPLPAMRRDELGRLSEVLDTMRVDLQRSYGEIEAQNRELRELDRLKDDFLANINHELRTPLNGLLGLGDAMLSGSYGKVPVSLRTPLDTMLASAQRLQALSEQILAFSQNASSDVPTQLQRINLQTYLRGLTEQFAVETRRKQIDLQLYAETTELETDPQLLEHIFANLMSNAVKFTHAGEITVQLDTRLPEAVVINVEDTGIGIPEEQQQRVFERFRQGFSSENREYEGAGIGLSLALQSAQQLGGRVLLKSQPGSGSRFSVILPRQRETEIDLDQLIKQWRELPLPPLSTPWRPIISSLSGDTRQPAQPPATEIEESSANSDISILVVDDDATNREVVSAYLRRHYKVIQAENGHECLNRLADGGIDLVLLDLMMPGLSGFDVLENLSRQQQDEYLPVIVLSARNQAESINRAFTLGAVDYISKPFNSQELLARVDTHLRLRAREQTLKANADEKQSTVEHSHRKLEQAEGQLQQQERLATIGRLAAGVAHEINNPAGALSSNLYSLRDYSRSLFRLLGAWRDARDEASAGAAQALEEQLDAAFIEEDLPTLLDDCDQGLRRITQVVTSLRDFASESGEAWCRTRLRDRLEETLSMFRLELSPDVTLTADIDELPEIHCQPTQLMHALLNLLNNAQQAIESSGRIEVIARSQADQIDIEVIDNGHGIPAEQLSRVFEPFFTTRQIGGGAGLGLSMARGVVQQHGGEISIDSHPDEGTHVSIRLPTKPQAVQAA